MTAIRNFPDAPRIASTAWPLPLAGFARSVWDGLFRFGQSRAAFELDLQAQRWSDGNPELARQLHASAAECRRAAIETGRTS